MSPSPRAPRRWASASSAVCSRLVAPVVGASPGLYWNGWPCAIDCAYCATRYRSSTWGTKRPWVAASMAARNAAATRAATAIRRAGRGAVTRWGASASSGAASAGASSSRTVLAMRHDTLAARWQRSRAMPGSDALLVSLEPWAWPWTALLLGLVVGSFANVCVYRLPQRRSLMRPGSACPGCGAPIRWFDNVPVLSWMLLRARCRRCGRRISVRYPLVEAANGALYLGLASLLPPGPRAFASMAFVTALLVLALIDLDWHILPDVI